MAAGHELSLSLSQLTCENRVAVLVLLGCQEEQPHRRQVRTKWPVTESLLFPCVPFSVDQFIWSHSFRVLSYQINFKTSDFFFETIYVEKLSFLGKLL